MKKKKKRLYAERRDTTGQLYELITRNRFAIDLEEGGGKGEVAGGQGEGSTTERQMARNERGESLYKSNESLQKAGS